MRLISALAAFLTALFLVISCGTASKGSSAAAEPTRDEVEAISSGLLPTGAEFRSAFALTAAGPRIFTVCTAAPDLEKGSVRIIVSEPVRKGWKQFSKIDYPAVTGTDFPVGTFLDSLSMVNVAGSEQLHFRTLASDSTGRKACLTSHLLKISTEEYRGLSFYGNDLSRGGAYKIEGRSDEVLRVPCPETSWLADQMAADPALIRLTDADIMADDAVQWWLDKNPGAMGSARSLEFGVIPAECSLVARYKAARDKQNASGWRAAMFDYRGYTSVVAYNKSTGGYSLVWTEPECRDHARGRLLNNIYFEQGSTLVLFYYQGKNTFKYRINLSSKTLRR